LYTPKCSLRNQTDILDDPIPSKLTLLVYSIWNMKCRYDPKYASQYKSKHTKHVKLSKKVRFPLDTQKEYLNREWPLSFPCKESLGIIDLQCCNCCRL
jgi:hypothetical protein